MFDGTLGRREKELRTGRPLLRQGTMSALPPDLQRRAKTILDAIPAWVASKKPMPKNDLICRAVGCRKTALRSLFVRMQKAGLIDMEITDTSRRIRLPGGEWTPWSTWSRDAELSRVRKQRHVWRTKAQQRREKRRAAMVEGEPRPDSVLFGSVVQEVLLLRRRGYEVVTHNGHGFLVDRKLMDAPAIIRLAARQQSHLSPLCTAPTTTEDSKNLSGSSSRAGGYVDNSPHPVGRTKKRRDSRLWKSGG